MGSAIWIGNRIGEAKNLIGIGVVVLEHALNKGIFLQVFALVALHLGLAVTLDVDDSRVNDRFTFAQFLDELLDTELVKKEGFSWLPFNPLINQVDLQTGIEESQLTQACPQPIKDKLDRGKDISVRQKGDLCSGVLLVF